jgi:hypothetical protein
VIASPRPGEVRGIPHLFRPRAEEVGIEGEDRIGGGKVIDGVHRRTECQACPFARVIVRDRVVVMPTRLRKHCQDVIQQRREGER